MYKRQILNPGTGKPVTVEDLAPVFCEELAKQELNTKDRYIEIPEQVREFYRMYRPSPDVYKRQASLCNAQAGIPRKLIVCMGKRKIPFSLSS